MTANKVFLLGKLLKSRRDVKRFMMTLQRPSGVRPWSGSTALRKGRRGRWLRQRAAGDGEIVRVAADAGEDDQRKRTISVILTALPAFPFAIVHPP